MGRIKITCEDPVHGWLPIRLVVDGQVIDIVSSDVPNNPVQDLVDALDAVLKGSTAKVFWPLEPGSYLFSFLPSEDRVQFSVSLAENDEIRHKNLVSIDASRDEILLPLWRFVRNFQSRNYEEPHWPAIDGRHMESIRASLRN